MKNKAILFGGLFLLFLIAGCAGFGTKSPAQLSKEYTKKAQAAEKKGDLAEALKQYKLVLTVDPKNKLAQEKRAKLEPQLNKLAEQHYRKGLKYYRQGQYPPARKEFLTALRYNPDHAEAKEKLTAAREEIKDVKRYIVHTLQADETISTLAERYYGDYRKFHVIAEYNEMEDATKVTVGQEIKIPVIEGTPILADPSTIQTDTAKAPEALPGEVITAKRYIIHTVEPDESLSKLSMMYYGDYAKYDLIAQFNNLEDGTSVRVGQELKIPEIEGVPFQVEGEVQETEAVSTAKAAPMPEKAGEKPEAAETIAKPISPEDQLVHYRELGVELYNNKEYAAAIAEFDKVLNSNPADQTARNYMSLAYREKGRQSFENKAYAKAEKEFETSLIYDPSCPDCQKYIDQIRKLDSDNLRQEAIALYDQKEYKQAIVKFQAVARDNPKDQQAREYLEKAHFQQGLHLFGKEDYLAARDEFKTALEYNPQCDQCEKNIQKSEDIYKEIHYEKGLTYFGDQKLAEAIQEWESVSAIDPNYKDVNKNLTKAKTLYERLESIKRSKTQQDKQ